MPPETQPVCERVTAYLEGVAKGAGPLQASSHLHKFSTKFSVRVWTSVALVLGLKIPQRITQGRQLVTKGSDLSIC